MNLKSRAYRSPAVFAVCLTLLHFGVVIFFLSRHALWRDEIEGWSIATEPETLAIFFRDIKYTGRPGFWYLCLRLLHTVGFGLYGMQLFNAILASISVFLIARFSPFSRFQQCLFAFGYFVVFEYAVISRNYSLDMLLILTICVLLTRQRVRHLLVVLCLIALASTSIYGLISSVLLTAYCMTTLLRASFWLAVLPVCGVALSLFQLMPPDDSLFAGQSTYGALARLKALGNPEYLWHVTTQMSVAFAPIPKFIPIFWNTSLFPLSFSGAGMAITLTILIIFIFSRRAAVLLAVSLIAFGLFSAIIFPGTLRHHGVIFIMFVASSWLSLSERTPFLMRPKQRRALRYCVTGLLWIQVVAGVAALYLSLRAPFSNGQAAARFIEQSGRANGPIAGVPEPPMMTVAGYLGRQVYFPVSNRYSRYIIFNAQAGQAVPLEKNIQACLNFFANEGNITLVLGSEVAGDLLTRYRMTKLATFIGSVAPDENYYIYNLPGLSAP